MKGRGRSKAPGGRGATTGGAESKKRVEGSREKERGGGTEKMSGRGRSVEENGRGRDTEKRGRAPERSGTLIRGGSHRRRGTTMVQKLDEDFFAFESFFRRGHELDHLPPLTKRQRIRYLPQETPEARQRREELTKEMGVPAVGGGSLCKRCADFGILCIPQNLP